MTYSQAVTMVRLWQAAAIAIAIDWAMYMYVLCIAAVFKESMNRPYEILIYVSISISQIFNDIIIKITTRLCPSVDSMQSTLRHPIPMSKKSQTAWRCERIDHSTCFQIDGRLRGHREVGGHRNGSTSQLRLLRQFNGLLL